MAPSPPLLPYSPQGYCKPAIVDGNRFSVANGVHPVVASQQLLTFVGNDCKLDEKLMWIVTGPNMGGKELNKKSKY